MTLLRNLRIQAFLLSLCKRSIKTHASLSVSDLARSLTFYERLGFRKVVSSRGDEVILLRNHRGDELNIISGLSAASSAEQPPVAFAAFRVENLNQLIPQLRSWNPELEIIDDAMTRRARLIDPDKNTVELYQAFDRSSLAEVRIYHIATQPELIAGLTEHYYFQPESENRFVRARARSAFIALACKRVAEETDEIPLVIEMDENELSVEEQLFDESDYDAPSSPDRSSYPRVNSPIPLHAIAAVGFCEQKDGDFSWPKRFVAVDSITAGSA